MYKIGMVAAGVVGMGGVGDCREGVPLTGNHWYCHCFLGWCHTWNNGHILIRKQKLATASLELQGMDATTDGS